MLIVYPNFTCVSISNHAWTRDLDSSDTEFRIFGAFAVVARLVVSPAADPFLCFSPILLFCFLVRLRPRELEADRTPLSVDPDASTPMLPLEISSVDFATDGEIPSRKSIMFESSEDILIFRIKRGNVNNWPLHCDTVSQNVGDQIFFVFK